jgi:hypothetical protein
MIKLSFAIFGLVASLLTTWTAQAGTVGVFRVAEDQILDSTSDGAQIFLEQTVFEDLARKVNSGEIVTIGHSNWVLDSGSQEHLMLVSESATSAEMLVLPAKD